MKYSDLSYDKIVDAVTKLFYGREEPKPATNDQPLDEKIVPGYWYRIHSGMPPAKHQRDIVLNTGCGGAKEFIKTSRELNIPDYIIASSIYIFLDESGWHRIDTVTVKKLEKI